MDIGGGIPNIDFNYLNNAINYYKQQQINNLKGLSGNLPSYQDSRDFNPVVIDQNFTNKKLNMSSDIYQGQEVDLNKPTVDGHNVPNYVQAPNEFKSTSWK